MTFLADVRVRWCQIFTLLRFRCKARRREELLKKKFAASTEIKCEQVSEKEAEVPRKAQTVLHHHPSPPASSERRQVTVVGREKVLPSFTQLDGEEDVSLLCAAEKEENIIAMEETWFDDPPFSELYKVPPAKVRHPDPDFGIGTYVRTNSDSGNFLYEFQIVQCLLHKPCTLYIVNQ